MTVKIETPSDYKLKSVILSHGWSDLCPFKVGEENKTIDVALSRNDKANGVAVFGSQGFAVHFIDEHRVGVECDLQGKAPLVTHTFAARKRLALIATFEQYLNGVRVNTSLL